jgi:hypothetical protein
VSENSPGRRRSSRPEPAPPCAPYEPLQTSARLRLDVPAPCARCSQSGSSGDSAVAAAARREPRGLQPWDGDGPSTYRSRRRLSRPAFAPADTVAVGCVDWGYLAAEGAEQTLRPAVTPSSERPGRHPRRSVRGAAMLGPRSPVPPYEARTSA